MSADYKEVGKGLPKEELEKYATGINLVGSFVDSLQKQGLLPKKFTKAVEPSTVQDYSATNPRERLVLPLKEQLIIAARADLPRSFGIEYDGPEPPDDLFADFESLAKAGVEVDELEVLYQR